MGNGTTSGLPSLLPWSRLGTCWAEDWHMDMLDRRGVPWQCPAVPGSGRTVPSNPWGRQWRSTGAMAGEMLAGGHGSPSRGLALAYGLEGDAEAEGSRSVRGIPMTNAELF